LLSGCGKSKYRRRTPLSVPAVFFNIGFAADIMIIRIEMLGVYMYE
jgi:hypothetical protein